MKLKKYLSFTRAGIVEALQFRTSFIVMVVGNLLYLVVVYFLWKSIYASAGVDCVNGMTFSDTLVYLVLATSMFGFMEIYAVWEMGRNIQSGKIVLDLLKPMDYRKYLFWTHSGDLVSQFLLAFLPTFIIVTAVSDGAIGLGLNLLYFAVSVVMAASINFSIDFITGTICVYTESIWGVNIMKQTLVLLLSGATIPLAFFPEPLRTIAERLPFQSIYNAPLSLLLEKDPGPSFVLETLGVQLFWLVAILLISKAFWRVSLRKITVNGG